MSIYQFTPIKKKNNEIKSFPLTQNQTAMWLDEVLFEGTNLYNLGGYYELKGSLNVHAFKCAVEQVVLENDIFRIRFSNNHNPIQHIGPPCNYSMPVQDFSLEKEAPIICLEKIHKQFTLPFSIDGELFQFELLKVGKDHFFWFVKIHHIILDGWGLSLFLQQVIAYYKQFKNSTEIKPLHNSSFEHYLKSEKKYLTSKGFLEDKNYWINKFQQLPPHLIERKNNRNQNRSLEILSERSWSIPKDITEEMNSFSKRNQISIPQIWLGILGVYFYKIYKKETICLGLPVLNRHNESEKNTLGLFVGMIPHLMDVFSELTFTDLLKQIKQTRRNDRPHQRFPLHQLIENLSTQSSGSRTLFDVVISFDQHSYSLDLEDCNSNFKFMRGGDEKMPLNLYLRQTDKNGQMELSFEFLSSYFSEWEVEMMIERLQVLTSNILKAPQSEIEKIDILPASETDLLLNQFSITKTDFPAKKSIIDLFEEQVTKTPNKVGLVFQDKKWTYRQINKAANKIAHHLSNKYHIQANEMIALQMERSGDMILAILGILKTGAAYVPLAIDLPSSRVEYILKECNSTILLTNKATESTNAQYSDLVSIEVLENISSDVTKNLQKTFSNQDLAYVMFTSGSTGQPKGVCVSHQNVVRLVKDTNYADFDAEHIFLHMAQVSFDASTFEIWGALLNGAQLVVMPFQHPSLEEIGQVIQDYQVSTAWMTAGLFHLMVDKGLEKLTSLRQLLAGGDVLSINHVKKALKSLKNCSLINGYGPTENTTFTTCCQINKLTTLNNSVPIGQPISNTEVFIFNQNQQLLPIGVAGELYTGGAGLSKGYLNRPELTAEKFIPHPSRDGAYLYKTGDLARWLPDGNIEFLGRIDQQVKIRGFRIETGEIEQRLLNHAAVKDAVVIGREMDNGKELIAYFVIHSSVNSVESFNVKELRKFLSKQLPSYMVPSYFVKMDKFPLSATGKVNRKTLPNPTSIISEKSIDIVAPRTPLETKLVMLWEKVLNIKGIGVSDNFFELGGHSLKVIQLVSFIKKELETTVGVSEVFSHPTIEALSEIISLKENTTIESIPVIEPQSSYVLSRAQHRLWLTSNLEKEQPTYNIPLAIKIKGKVDPRILEQVIGTMMARHEILRTNFILKNGTPKQIIRPIENFQLPLISFENQTKASLKIYITKHGCRPFDLANDNLFRTELITEGRDEYVWLLNFHHIIFDGWSLNIFFEELSTLYESYSNGEMNPLPKNLFQYKDYASWHNNLLTENTTDKARKYWEVQLEGLPILEIPTDFSRPSVKTYNGSNIDITLAPSLTRHLDSIAQSNGSTLFMVLTTLVNVLLYKHSGQKDIVIGTPSAGRNHPELQQQVGFYVNTLALRNQFEASDSFLDVLAKVKQTTLSAFENELYPFDELVGKFSNSKDRSRSPIFDVMIVLQNQKGEILKIGDTEIKIEPTKTNTSKFDLTFSFTENKN